MKQKLDSQVRIAHDEDDESVLSEGKHDQLHLTHALDDTLQTLKRLPIPQAAPRELAIGSSQDSIVAEIEPECTEYLDE